MVVQDPETEGGLTVPGGAVGSCCRLSSLAQQASSSVHGSLHQRVPHLLSGGLVRLVSYPLTRPLLPLDLRLVVLQQQLNALVPPGQGRKVQRRPPVAILL
jgi:hypothetical protein